MASINIVFSPQLPVSQATLRPISLRPATNRANIIVNLLYNYNLAQDLMDLTGLELIYSRDRFRTHLVFGSNDQAAILSGSMVHLRAIHSSGHSFIMTYIGGSAVSTGPVRNQ